MNVFSIFSVFWLVVILDSKAALYFGFWTCFVLILQIPLMKSFTAQNALGYCWTLAKVLTVITDLSRYGLALFVAIYPYWIKFCLNSLDFGLLCSLQLEQFMNIWVRCVTPGLRPVFQSSCSSFHLRCLDSCTFRTQHTLSGWTD